MSAGCPPSAEPGPEAEPELLATPEFGPPELEDEAPELESLESEGSGGGAAPCASSPVCSGCSALFPPTRREWFASAEEAAACDNDWSDKRKGGGSTYMI